MKQKVLSGRVIPVRLSLVLTIIGLQILYSCNMCEVGGDLEEDPGPWYGPQWGSKHDHYIVGVDYPDDYDWHADQMNGTVRCSLVVFGNSVPVLKVPVGPQYCVSPDADTHYFIDSHLYTYYCKDSVVVIKKDGGDFLRYHSEEKLCGILVKDEELYTLANNSSGQGFTFRKNGEIIIGRSRGKAYPHLYEDQGDICFSFCEPVLTSSGEKMRYNSVVDGKVSLVEYPDKVVHVWDMVRHQRQMYSVTSDSDYFFSSFHRGDSSARMRIPYYGEMMNCSIIPSGDKVYIPAVFRRSQREYWSGIWEETTFYEIFTEGEQIISSLPHDGGICYVVKDSDEIVIHSCGSVFPMPEGYYMMSGNAMASSDSSLIIGLSSESLEKPLLWRNSRIDTLKMNGFITDVSFR